ncbi:hypothetical protein ASG22_00105 [Chryseobacterium sp. Leaf405]|uniref:hypothetical protein n=1 Tax=Chryseobacterium sp. Leaf405 TaxID=1736367 RepID=UPI0006F214F9|nr:hypothetical protein [Chryseobacterium sp. Leaf405]KQT35470.1 hypothetical protein ASG22_00105 [Chryseobacterium sp. Leaf405]
MEHKLNEIFQFLKENRKYNKELQEKYYSSIILPFETKEDKLTSALYNIASTQNKPKINELSTFFKQILGDKNSFSSFNNFVEKINPSSKKNYQSLFEGMRRQKGWGDKTSALFTKIIFHLHNKEYSQRLSIWDDVPQFSSDDKFFLPVDFVIISIFNRIQKTNWNFKKINDLLHTYYTGDKIEIWDDLWFWGFITQHGSGINRDFKWNENKYWMMKESNKNENIISEIKSKTTIFLDLIDGEYF